MEELGYLMHGFSVALTGQHILMMFIGVTLGILILSLIHI